LENPFWFIFHTPPESGKGCLCFHLRTSVEGFHPKKDHTEDLNERRLGLGFIDLVPGDEMNIDAGPDSEDQTCFMNLTDRRGDCSNKDGNDLTAR
jgi:hypothetical protein